MRRPHVAMLKLDQLTPLDARWRWYFMMCSGVTLSRGTSPMKRSNRLRAPRYVSRVLSACPRAASVWSNGDVVCEVTHGFLLGRSPKRRDLKEASPIRLLGSQIRREAASVQHADQRRGSIA